jgi:hypothetical protein
LTLVQIDGLDRRRRIATSAWGWSAIGRHPGRGAAAGPSRANDKRELRKQWLKAGDAETAASKN